MANHSVNHSIFAHLSTHSLTTGSSGSGAFAAISSVLASPTDVVSGATVSLSTSSVLAQY